MNGALVLAVLLIVLFGRLKKRLRSKHWKPVTATVLRIQAVDPRIGKDTVGPRKYRLDLVFDWQGLDWHRSWYFPRTYDLPQAGDTLSLLYNQKDDQLLDEEVEKLIEQRNEARKNKDWATADRIRDELKARHIVLEDTPQGVKWKVEE